MIRKDVIYQKSPKGQEAIGNRQLGLAPKLRSALILVDGKRGVDEIARLSAVLGDPEQLLGQLLADGYIEESTGRAPPPAAASASPSPAAAPTVSLPEAKRHAVRRLTDILGPTAEELCLRIESARSVQEYLAALAKAEGIVRGFRGQEAAAAFAADMQSHRPG